jgi:hypothetical protein
MRSLNRIPWVRGDFFYISALWKFCQLAGGHARPGGGLAAAWTRGVQAGSPAAGRRALTQCSTTYRKRRQRAGGASRSGRDARQRKKDEARRMTLTMACVQCPCSLGRHDPRCGPLPGKKSKARLWTSASLWTYAPLYPLRPEAAAPTFTLLSRFAPVRGLVISSQTFACNNRATWTADHFSPGGAGMPRSSRPAAMARSDPHNRTP